MHVFSITFIFQFHLKCMNFLFKNIGEKIYNIAIPYGNIQFRPFFEFIGQNQEKQPHNKHGTISKLHNIIIENGK